MKKIILIIPILFISLFAFSQAPEEWRKVNGTMYSVAYAPTNPSLILASTEDGVIRKSTDGGISWKEKNTGTIYPITSLKPFNDTKFIGLTSNSEVVQSIDAGETWSVSILKDSFNNKIPSLTEIVILSPTEAFVKTVAAISTTLYTDDNGATWSYYEFRQPKSLFQINDTLVGLDHLQYTQFTKALGILRSTDKGKTYDTLAILPSGLVGNDFNNQFKKGYENISFINAKTFFINVNGRTFFKTTNGGVSFTEIDYPGSNFVYDLFFTSPTEGYVTVSGSSVQHTKDGGTTWAQLKNKDSFLGPYVIKHLHNVNNQLFMMDNYISYTIDNSALISTPQSVAPENFLKASIINDSTLLSPFENYFYKSTNGGVTWNKTNEIKNEFNDKVNYDSYATRGNDSIFVNANTKIYLSTDAGTTFSLIHTTTRFNPQYTYFKHLQDDDLVMVGNGVIKYTLDGGTTWTEYNTGTFHSPNAIEVASLKAIYGLDYSRNVVFSSDSGKTFSMVNGDLPNRANATKLHFLNDSIGFLYGNSSFLYRTENGGATWQNLKDSIVGDGRFLNWDHMTSKNENEVYIMDADGNGGIQRIWYSLDAGKSWKKGVNNLRLATPKIMSFKNGAQGMSTNTSAIYRSGFYQSIVSEIDVSKSITGISYYSIEDDKFSFYPNPFSNELHIDSKYTITKLEVLNANGVLINTLNNVNKLTLGTLSPGIYLINVHTTDKVKTIKVIKE